MRTSIKLVVLVGVTLSVVPFFSSVFAQQSGSRADLFLEMQGLRSEIADLRDMVERQQYQMKKLQRSLEQPADQRAYSNNQSQRVPSYQQAPSATIDGSRPQYVENSAGGVSPSYSNQATIPANRTIASPGSDLNYADSRTNSPGTLANEVNQGNVNLNDGYRTNTPGPITSERSTSQYSVLSNTPVEERTIGAPQQPSSGTGYPPVIERSIGGVNNTNSNMQSSVQDLQAVGDSQVVQYPIDASATPQAPRSIDNSAIMNPNIGATDIPQTLPSSGVIAIPNNAGGNSVRDGVYSPSVNEQPQLNGGLNQQTASVQAPFNETGTTGLSEQEYYQQAFGLLKESKHEEAIDIFKQQISSFPQGDYADDGHYWIGESMYVNRSLDESKQYFRAIIDNFPQSPRLPDAMLKTAYIEEEQDNVIEARILLQEIIQYHPRSNAAISAKNRLPELK